MIAAAAAAGVERLVLTSSSAVFGSSARPEARTEEDAITPDDASAYALSKVRQATAAFAAATQAGIDIVAVCPTLVVGAWDYGLSQSNAVLVKYLNDPFRTTFAGGCNVVSAVDAARVHLLVAERGSTGSSYLVGGGNVHWRDVHAEVAALCHTYGPLVTATHTAAYLTAVWSELTARGMATQPAVTREEVRMMGRWYWYDDARARALGYRPGDRRSALLEALRWLVRTDHLRPDVRAALLAVDELAAPVEPARALEGS
jgi:dihydroflavonol-4-reductase